MPRKFTHDADKFQIHVSARDREIYEAVAVQGRLQREVAAEFKISQPRVSKIVQRAFKWLCQTAPGGLPEMPRPQRLYGVSRTYKMKLEYYEQRAMRVFDRSERDELITTTYDLKEGEDGKWH
jgi:hypothetical protein